MLNRLAVLFVLCIAAATSAWAHGLEVVASRVGDGIQGRAYLRGGAGATDAHVALVTDGRTVARTQTQSDGRFSFPVSAPGDVTVVVNGLDGHVARYAVPAAQSSDPAAGGAVGVDPAAIEAAVARQIAPLKAEVHALSHSIRLHDILGGLGWIAGIFGLVVWLRARRKDAAP